MLISTNEKNDRMQKMVERDGCGAGTVLWTEEETLHCIHIATIGPFVRTFANFTTRR